MLLPQILAATVQRVFVTATQEYRRVHEAPLAECPHCLAPFTTLSGYYYHVKGGNKTTWLSALDLSALDKVNGNSFRGKGRNGPRGGRRNSDGRRNSERRRNNRTAGDQDGVGATEGGEDGEGGEGNHLNVRDKNGRRWSLPCQARMELDSEYMIHAHSVVSIASD
jgi:hypothetical protein